MPKKGHTDKQIVALLRQAEAGEKLADQEFEWSRISPGQCPSCDWPQAGRSNSAGRRWPQRR